MALYCNTQKYLLRQTDFDFKDELKFSALLSLAEESASFSAEELGFGYEALKKWNYGFIIVNTYCEIYRPVRLGEPIEVDTWPLPPRHVIFERDYRFRVGKETVAAIASRWCLVDLTTFSLLTPDKMGEVHAKCPYRAEKTVETPSWKIPASGNAREVYQMRVGNSQCDHYLHANNTRYADFFLDCFSQDELRSPVRSFQISYERQAKEGAELLFTRSDEGEYSVCEAKQNGETISRFRLRFSR